MSKFRNQLLDKNSPVPYHYQLSEIIRDSINGGSWQKGDQLPTEKELCEIFDISRITVRKALDALVTDGLIYRVKGVGTFINEPKYLEKWSGFPIGFTDSLSAQGIGIETRTLDMGIVPPTEKAAEELGLAADEPVVRLERLRFINQEPILLVVSFLPAHLVPDLLKVDFTRRSLYRTLRTDYGHMIDRVKRGIEAVAASPEQAHLLQIEAGAPLLQIESTSYLPDGTPIEYFVAKRRGDRTRFEFELSKPPPFNQA